MFVDLRGSERPDGIAGLTIDPMTAEDIREGEQIIYDVVGRGSTRSINYNCLDYGLGTKPLREVYDILGHDVVCLTGQVSRRLRLARHSKGQWTYAVWSPASRLASRPRS